MRKQGLGSLVSPAEGGIMFSQITATSTILEMNLLGIQRKGRVTYVDLKQSLTVLMYLSISGTCLLGGCNVQVDV